MSIKSSVMSELDHQMSVSLIDFASPLLNPTSKFDLLKNWAPDCSAQDRNLTNIYQTQNMSSRKKKKKSFLPDAILPGWLKILHLIQSWKIVSLKCIHLSLMTLYIAFTDFWPCILFHCTLVRFTIQWEPKVA